MRRWWMALLALAGCHAADGPEPFGRLSLAQVEQELGKPGVAVFDDNSEDSFRSGHLPGARWLASSDVAPERLPADKNEKLIFYCGGPL